MIDIPALRWPEIQRVMLWYTGTVRDTGSEDLSVDSLMALFVENRAAINADVCDHSDVMIRYDSDTSEVIGLEIELFEYDFLERHPELAKEWVALKPEGDDGFHNSSWLTSDVALYFANRLKKMAKLRTPSHDGSSADRRDQLVWQKSDVPA